MAKARNAAKKSFWQTITHPKDVSPEDYVRTVRKVTKVIGGAFVVSLIVFLVLAVVGGWNSVISVIRSANLEIYALAFLSVFLGYLISFGKWEYFMRVVGLHVPVRENLPVYLSLYSMEFTPGRIGRVITAYTLHRITNIRLINIVPIVTADIFTDFLGLGFTALVLAIYLNQDVLLVLVADLVLTLPFLFFVHDWFYKIMKKYLIKNPENLRIFTVYGKEYFESQRKLNKLKVYLVSMGFTIPSSILYALSLYFSLAAIGVSMPAASSVFIYSTSQVIGSLSLLPGSVGVADASFVTLLRSMGGLGPAVSSAVTIMTRAASLWFGLLVGGVFFFYTLRYWNLKPSELRGIGSARRKRRNKN